MEKGYYVKYFGGSWGKSTYTFQSTFYDYVFSNVDYIDIYISFLTKVYDTQNGTLVDAKNIANFHTRALKELEDAFGSESVNSEYLAKIFAYERNSNEVQKNLQKLFPPSSFISSVDGDKVTLISGVNIGVKEGYKFRVISDGYTAGFINIEEISTESSVGKIFYLIPYEKINPYTIAVEAQNFPQNFGGILHLYIYQSGTGVSFGYVGFDIYGNYALGISLGHFKETFKDRIESAESTEGFYFEINKMITQNISYFVKLVALSDSYYFSTGFRLSSYNRDSVFSFRGIYPYIEINANFIIHGASILNNLPILIIGLEASF
jgi:hypothetical protein